MMLPLLAPNAALFLDVDGTLIEFVPRPEDARVPPALLDTIYLCQRRQDWYRQYAESQFEEPRLFEQAA